MKFETKFDIDEIAWYMKNNAPTKVLISAIEIFHVNTNQDRIKYNARNARHPVSWLDHTNLFENILFKTKADLLKSLFNTGIVCKGKNCSAIDGVDHSNECVEEHEKQYIN